MRSKSQMKRIAMQAPHKIVDEVFRLQTQLTALGEKLRVAREALVRIENPLTAYKEVVGRSESYGDWELRSIARAALKAIGEGEIPTGRKGQVRERALPFPGANKPECDNPNGPCYCGAWHSQENE